MFSRISFFTAVLFAASTYVSVRAQFSSSSSYCTICRDGSAILAGSEYKLVSSSFLSFDWYFSTYCLYADEYFAELGLLAEDPECDYLQGWGSGVCGCPPPVKPCTFCADGSPVADPNKIGTLLNFEDDPTCGFAEQAASFVEADSPVCNTLRYTGYAHCGCSSPPVTTTEGACPSLCGGGGPIDASLAGFNLFGDDSYYSTYYFDTCADFEAAAPYAYSSCNSYLQLYFWLACGCASPPPPIAEVYNQCQMCSSNTIEEDLSQPLFDYYDSDFTCGDWKQALTSINTNLTVFNDVDACPFFQADSVYLGCCRFNYTSDDWSTVDDWYFHDDFWVDDDTTPSTDDGNVGKCKNKAPKGLPKDGKSKMSKAWKGGKNKKPSTSGGSGKGAGGKKKTGKKGNKNLKGGKAKTTVAPTLKGGKSKTTTVPDPKGGKAKTTMAPTLKGGKAKTTKMPDILKKTVKPIQVKMTSAPSNKKKTVVDEVGKKAAPDTAAKTTKKRM